MGEIFKSKLTGRRKIAENTFELSFKRPEDFNFKAGQYIQVGLPKLLYPDYKGASRVFSISSSTKNKEKISIAFRDTGSGFKKTFKDLPLASSVLIEGPYGFFTFSQNPSKPIVFIAGGIGITPSLSMIRFSTEENFPCPITLLYSNKGKESTAYLKELEDIEKRNKHFVLKKKFGRIDKNFIEDNVRNIDQCMWHITGPPSMVDNIRNTLRLMGIEEDKIFFEEFSGY